MTRTSNYTIFVDLPDFPDEVLLVHGYTGAYDKVSKGVAKFLRSRSGKNGGKAGGNGFQPSEETLEVLQRRGYLTDKSREEEESLVEKLAETLAARDMHNAPGYVFMPTYSCNLRCPYCFQDHMRTDPANRHLLRTMSRETVDRIFASMPAIEERHGMNPEAEKKPSILFFGGEPLLAASRPIIEYIIEKGRERNMAGFSAISNATELDAYEDLLGPEGISSIQVTLDGPPEEHDQRRIYADGSGSFEKIARNISMALEKGTRITVRMNIDRENVEKLPALAGEIKKWGWPSSPGFSAYVAPIHAGNDKTEEETTMDSWVLKKSLNELVEDYPEVKIIGHSDNSLLSRLRGIFENRNDPMPGFRVGFCAAQSTMYIFDSFADVYACWEHTGDPEIRVGHVSEDGEFVSDGGEEERDENWRSRSILSNPQCKSCRFAFYCGGGCANLAWSRTGDIHTSFCDGFAHRFKAAASLAYGDFITGAEAAEVEEAPCDV